MSNNSCQIITPTSDFNYDYLSLGQPFPLQGGSYFTRLLNNNNNLYIKTKPCCLKQGIVQTEHKTYMDIILTSEDVHYIEWFEKLESSLQKLIFAKRKLWFDNDLELEDIENVFTNVIRPYKSGKLHLVRCNLGKPSNIYNSVRIYNEREEVISYKDIKDDSRIISILEVTGVKFSSRSFNVELSVKQIMLLENSTPFQKCLIKPENDYSYQDSMLNSCVQSTNEERSEDDEDDEDEDDDQQDVAVDNDGDEPTAEIEAQPEEVEKLKEVEELDKEEIKEDNNSNVTESVDNTCVSPNNVDSKDTIGDTNSLSDKEVEDEVVTPKENNLGNKVKFQNDVDDKEVVQEANTSDNLDDLLVEIQPDDETVHLRNPNEVYKELYLEARRKAKMAKNQALQAFLEAKKIKSQYLLDELEDDSDDENIDMFSENMA